MTKFINEHFILVQCLSGVGGILLGVVCLKLKWWWEDRHGN